MWDEIAVPAQEFAPTVVRSTAGGQPGPGSPGGLADGGRFAGLFGSARADGSVVLRAAIARYGRLDVVTTVVPATSVGGDAGYPALTPAVPGAAWYEREIADMFGLLPEGHRRVDPLVLPRQSEASPPRPGSPVPMPAATPDEAYLPAHVSGEGIFTIPYGPVRSGVFESVQYLVETPGEDIPHVRARVYHKHRGLERRFQGLSALDGVLLAERAEGVASVAHALAFCQAIEAIASANGLVPPGALLTRSLHAELERIANHLDSMVRHAEAAGQAVAYARFSWH
jgi:hypothetical protein